MRKPAFRICESKAVDQLCGNRTYDQRLCFHYIDSTIPNFEPLAVLCGCTAWFVSDLVRNPEDRFSYYEAHICPMTSYFIALSIVQQMGHCKGGTS